MKSHPNPFYQATVHADGQQIASGFVSDPENLSQLSFWPLPPVRLGVKYPEATLTVSDGTAILLRDLRDCEANPNALHLDFEVVLP